MGDQAPGNNIPGGNDPGIPSIPVTGTPDPGPGGGAGGGGTGGGGGAAPPPDPSPPPAQDMQVVTIHGAAPSAIPAVQTVLVLGTRLPLATPMQQVAARVPDNCTDYGIAVVCVRGKRPPLASGDPALHGPTPWWPQWACNMAHILCSDGPEPEQRDDERIPGSEVCGKTLDELYAICDAQDAAFITQCNLNRRLGVLDYRGFLACTERTTAKLAACRRTARNLTNNGAYPAKCD